MYTLDKAISNYKEDLKKLITKFENDLNDKKFETIYTYISDYFDDAEAPAFTALLLKNNINPLEYMDYIPEYFTFDLDIESFAIPNNITHIGNYAFQYSGLKSIHIPKSVINIGKAVFYECNSLTDVYYKGSEEDWKNIKIEYANASLFGANIHYNS